MTTLLLKRDGPSDLIRGLCQRESRRTYPVVGNTTYETLALDIGLRTARRPRALCGDDNDHENAGAFRIAALRYSSGRRRLSYL